MRVLALTLTAVLMLSSCKDKSEPDFPNVPVKQETPVPQNNNQVRIIPIPKEEHGYGNFETVVITSQSELDAFLKQGSNGKQAGWNNRADFEKAISEAKLDFSKEALVLLRHTEGSGSVKVSFRQPTIKDKKVICQIDRKAPEIGTADMAYYCFAIAVIKADVTEIVIQVEGQSPSTVSMINEVMK